MTRAILASLEKEVRARCGASVAETFERRAAVARTADPARVLEILNAFYRCVVLSESGDQLVAGLQSIQLESQ